MSLRWDKYIWAVRLAKTRSQASEALSKGKIKINHASIKPSKEPKVGDTIQIARNTAVFSYKVVQLLDKRVGAKLVVDFLVDTTPEEEIEKFKTYQLAQQVYRSNGTGKPSKKDRRDLDDYLTDWE
jgi:ribosome-associated heat shock protein Hsp15